MENRLRSVSPRERALYLKTLPFARDLNTDAVMMLALQMRERQFRDGARLLRQDEPIEGVFLLTSGRVEFVQDDESVGALEAPGRVGLIGLLSSGPGEHVEGAPGDVVADSTVEALEIPADVLDHLLAANFEIRYGVTRWIASQLLDQPPYEPFASTCDDLEVDRAEKFDLFERLRWLHESPIFEDANLDVVLELARQQYITSTEKGECLWEPGDETDRIFSVVRGTVELRSPSSEEPSSENGSIARVGSRGFLGLLEGLSETPRQRSARVVEPLVALTLDLDVLLEMLEDHADVSTEIIRTLAASALERRWSAYCSTSAAGLEIRADLGDSSAHEFGSYDGMN